MTGGRLGEPRKSAGADESEADVKAGPGGGGAGDGAGGARGGASEGDGQVD